jgi:hypothetical protein
MKKLPCASFLLTLLLLTTTFAEDLGYRQVRVTLEWRREGIIKEEYPDNQRNGKYTMVVNATWDTLLRFDLEDKGEGLQQNSETTATSSPVSGTVSFIGESHLSKPEAGFSTHASINFSGKLSPDAIYLKDVASVKEFLTTPRVEVEMRIPMHGKVTGFPATLGPAAGLGMFQAPFSGDPSEAHLEASLTLFGSFGPRPSQQIAQQAYDVSKGLNEFLEKAPAATTAAWTGATYSGSGKTWRFQLQREKAWDIGLGSVKDTLKFEMVPTRKTLPDPKEEEPVAEE